MLQGFHRVWDLASYWFNVHKETSLGADGRIKKIPQKLGKEFDKALPIFLTWLCSLFNPNQLAKESESVRAMWAESKLSLDDVKQIKWVTPNIEAGDLFAWDHRLPHHNLPNKSDIERIVAYVSLYERKYMAAAGGPSKEDIHGMFLGTKAGGHAGSNRANKDERQVFQQSWQQRIEFKETPTSCLALGGTLDYSTMQQQPEEKGASLEEQTHMRELGWARVPRVLSSELASKIATELIDETLQIALQGEDLAKLQKKMSKKDMKMSLLLNDYKLRKTICKQPKCVWVGGDSRQPRVSKNNGMVNIYHNPSVRTHISFSPRIYAIIGSFYLLASLPLASLGIDGSNRLGLADMDDGVVIITKEQVEKERQRKRKLSSSSSAADGANKKACVEIV